MSARIQNTLGGRGKASAASILMKPMVILTLVLVGLFSFAALITLSGFADEFKDGNNGQAHALSRSAVGYAGLVKLLGEQEYVINLKRNTNFAEGETNTLHVITLSRPVSSDVLPEMDLDQPTLIVLPKWLTRPMRTRRGWVDRLPENFPQTYGEEGFTNSFSEFVENIKFEQAGDKSDLAYNLSGRDRAWPYLQAVTFDNLQTLSGDNLTPVVQAGRKTILAQIDDTAIYILSEPDILNNHGLASRDRARFANEMISTILRDEFLDTDRVIFDLSLHGFNSKNNLIKVLLTPPFLTATLCLLAAGLLIGWQAFTRFGDPKDAPRDYALGKFSLADNAARFIKIAERETQMAPGYIDLIRRRTAKNMHIHNHTISEIDDILTRRSETRKMDETWSTLKTQAENAQTEDALLNAAKNLHDWKQEITHDR